VDGNGAEDCLMNHFGVCLVDVRQIGSVDFIVTKITLLSREPNLRVSLQHLFPQNDVCFCLHLTQLYCRN
jgi:hypothetical protein